MPNTAWETSNNSFPLFPVPVNTLKECLGLGLFFTSSKAKLILATARWDIWAAKEIQAISTWSAQQNGKILLAFREFLQQKQAYKKPGKIFSWKCSLCCSATLSPRFPLPATLLSWGQWELPHRSGRALQEHLLCWLREELILCKFSSGFFTHHFTTPYPYLHTKEKLEKFHGSWLQWYFVRQAEKEPGHTFNI